MPEFCYLAPRQLIDLLGVIAIHLINRIDHRSD